MIVDPPEFHKEYFAKIGLGNENIVIEQSFFEQNDLESLLVYLKTREYPYPGHNGYHSIFEADVLSESPDVHHPIVRKYIDKSLDYVNTLYQDRYGISLKNHPQKQKFQFAKMTAGMNNSTHRDYNLNTEVPFGSLDHNVVVMLYLNEDFSGGQITFPENSITYQPKSGSLVTFPANYLHEVLRVDSGDRYTAMLIFSFQKDIV